MATTIHEAINGAWGYKRNPVFDTARRGIATLVGSGNFTTGTTSTTARYAFSIRHRYVSSNFFIFRSYLAFDVSNINTLPGEVTLTFLPYSLSTQPDIRVVYSSAFGGDGATNLATTDWDSIYPSYFLGEPQDPLNGIVSTVAYTGEVNTSVMANEVDFTISLNSNARAAVSYYNYFICAIITTYDFNNNGLLDSTDRKIGMYYNEYLNIGYKPYLTVTTRPPNFIGNISYIHFNKATLTAAEVKQNYNTLKHRFK